MTDQLIDRSPVKHAFFSANMAKPELWKIHHIPGLKKEDRRLLNGHWVLVDRLCECVNHVLMEAGFDPCIENDSEMFSRYGVLNGFDQEEGTPFITWANELGYAAQPDHGYVPTEEQLLVKTYVPAAWAMNILEVAAKGIVNVTCLSALSTGDCSGGRAVTVNRWRIMGRRQDGAEREIEVKGLLPLAKVRVKEPGEE